MTAITLLDGSIGQELVKRTGDRATPLWSTQVMMENPDAVGAVHRDYLAAGATVISANSYALHHNRLKRAGLEHALPQLMDTALKQAAAARATAPAARIAGCLGPYLASYRPDLDPDPEEAAVRFAEITAMMRGRVDFVLLETVSSAREAEGALSGAGRTGLPIWIAFTVCDDDGTRLRSGEPVEAILPVIENRVEAVLINCSRPEVIGDALPVLAQSGLEYGAYGNGFEGISDEFKKDAPTVDTLEQRTDLGPSRYADFAMAWVDAGATIVGGCCEIGPAHIFELARRLTAAGHVIV